MRTQVLAGPRCPDIVTFLLKITLSTYSPETRLVTFRHILYMSQCYFSQNIYAARCTWSDKYAISIFGNIDCSADAWKIFGNCVQTVMA